MQRPPFHRRQDPGLRRLAFFRPPCEAGPQADGSRVLDRTTLTPLPAGRVRQVIEQSRDGGDT